MFSPAPSAHLFIFGFDKISKPGHIRVFLISVLDFRYLRIDNRNPKMRDRQSVIGHRTPKCGHRKYDSDNLGNRKGPCWNTIETGLVGFVATSVVIIDLRNREMNDLEISERLLVLIFPNEKILFVATATGATFSHWRQLGSCLCGCAVAVVVTKTWHIFWRGELASVLPSYFPSSLICANHKIWVLIFTRQKSSCSEKPEHFSVLAQGFPYSWL